MLQVQDQSLDLLTCSPLCYHCAMVTLFVCDREVDEIENEDYCLKTYFTGTLWYMK